eukprot:TRINITY_DN1012_c0_g1_i2.p1 TRINITY_DN1012_c0_g1~~TRINITY_DN1012_c0_g1_i2.p1  ORF type:complete len:277 (-),score=11.61 TRINITY_DN1012_c0_g1_i2:78-908(-)
MDHKISTEESLVPEYLKSHFINKGYRVGYTSFNRISQSLFELHNETVNIWTHLLLAIYWIREGIWWLNTGSQGVDLVAILVYIVMCAFCLLSSASYHLYHVRDFGIFKLTRSIDFIGTSCIMISSNFVLVHFSFWCFPGLTQLYMFTTLVAGFTLLYLPFSRVAERTTLRVIAYCSVMVVPLVECVHLYHLEDRHAIELSKHVMLSVVYYAIGLVFYVSKFPEVLFPGKFDFIGHSHQFWHIFVFLGQFALYNGCVQIMMDTTPRLCSSPLSANLG